MEWITTRAKMLGAIASAVIGVPTAALFVWNAGGDALDARIDARIVSHHESESLPAQISGLCSILLDMAADDPRRDALEVNLATLRGKFEGGPPPDC